MKKFYSVGTIFLILFVQNSFAAGILSFQHIQRLNEPLGGEVDDQFIDFVSRNKREGTRWDGVVDLSFRFYPESNNFIYSPSEFYLEKNQGRSFYSAGRKIVDWDPTERFWGLGELNGQKAFNLLETKREGLMGIHLGRRGKVFEYQFFASPVHIPQVNPTFKNEGDKILGKNEWSNPPPQFVRFRGEDIPVSYSVIYPDAKEIVLHNSAGLYLAAKGRAGKVFAYTTFKPETSIRTNATGYYEQFGEERAVVKAKPFINHHIISGGGWSKGWGNWKTTIHALRINPEVGSDESFEFEALKIQPVFVDESFAMAQIEYTSDFFSLSLNSINLIEGDLPNSNVFAKKPRWRRALGFHIGYSPIDKIFLEGDYRHDLKLKDTLIRAKAIYQISKHWNTQVGVEMIDSPELDSYWAPYRSNDSFSSQIGYTF